MSAQIIIQIVLFGIALAMDAFAVSITDGLLYRDINKKKSVFIASTFGVMQGIMPLIGFFLIYLVSYLVGIEGGKETGKILSIVVTWLSFSLLIIIGTKMLIEGIKSLKTKEEDKESKLFSYKEVLVMGVVTAIDALAVGVSLSSGLSTNVTIWLHVSIIMVITFVLSLIGVFLGKRIVKLFKGKQEISVVIGGCILLLLAIWIVISHYIGI